MMASPSHSLFLRRLWSARFGLTFVLAVGLLLPSTVSSAEADAHRPTLTAGYGRLPLSFEKNEGQTDSHVTFLARGNGYTLFVTPTEAVLALRQSKGSRPGKENSPLPTEGEGQGEGAILRMQFLGANPTPVVTGLKQLPGIVNYFLGDDPKKWRTNIPTYARVQFTEVYPGIDLHYYGNQRQLEYDVIVAPGADPRVIQLGFTGHDHLTRTRDGHLILTTAVGEVRLLKPHVYQTVHGKKVEVAANYILQNPSSSPSPSRGEGKENSPPPHRGGGSGWGEKGHQVALQVGIHVAAYDHKMPLIIDPVLSYSTYLGGSGADAGYGIAVDAAGNAYVTGYTYGSGFPGTAGSAIQPTYNANGDLFVSKLNAAGSAILYSTYLGGHGTDYGAGIAVDAAGNAYVTGYTYSIGSGFPGTGGSAIQPTLAGGDDAFVAKICLDQVGTPATWSGTIGNMGTSRSDYTATFLPTGKVLVAGGVNTQALNSAEVFDPVTGIFTAVTTTMTDIRSKHTATLLPNSKILVAGGAGTTTVFSTADLFDPTANGGAGGFAGTGSMLTSRSLHTATLLSTGKVLMAGGFNSAALTSAELFDPAANSGAGVFGGTGSMGTGRVLHTATLLPNGKVLIVGGGNANGSVAFATAELYDPATGTFTATTGSMSIARRGHAAVLLSTGKVLIAGGKNPGSSALASAEIFDPATGLFSATGSLGTARVFASAPRAGVVLPNGRVLLSGGTDGTNALASAELYDPTAGTFISTGAMGTARDRISPVLLASGEVLVVGGKNGGTAVATAERYATAFCGPEVNSLSPAAGPTGTTVTIYGINFKGTQGSSTVTFNGVTASSVTSWSDSQIVAAAPSGATTGPVVVTVNNVRSNNTRIFSLPPLAPTGLSAVAGNAQVTLTWTPSTTSGVTEQRIFRATTSGGPYGLVGTLSGNSNTSFVNSLGVTNGTTYFYVVRAFNGAESPNSNQASATPALPAPVPAVTMLSPNSATAGGSAFTLTVNGSNFVASSVVRWNGTDRTTTFVSATQLQAAISAADIVAVGTAAVTVFTPAPGGGTSNTVNFTINPPPPTIASFSPVQGRLGTLVTITGTNFSMTPAANQVTIGGASAGVLSASATQLVTSVPLSAVTGLLAVTTAGGTAQGATNFTVISITGVSVTPSQTTLPVGAAQQFRGTAIFSDQSTLDVTALMAWTSSNQSSVTVSGTGLAQGVAVGTSTITGTLGSLNGSGPTQVIADSGGGPLPPDPATVAPPADRTVATTFGQASAFLYTGSNPIQTGVAPGTIDVTHVAVLRGMVGGRDGFPLPGVTITILGHPEFGQTLTRPDGMFDLAVNGGGLLTVKYDKSGYLPAQRQVLATWQDYPRIPNVVLVPLDPQVTTVVPSASAPQVAQGSVVTDADGTRQATLLFTAGTTATMKLPDGSTQPLTTMSVRATEYTVGPSGPMAMPALLPPTSAYTYAVEYSVDQALTAGATAVQFNQPVLTYVQNFLNFPVGTMIPSGYYDRSHGSWVASTNGQVIKILTSSGGTVTVDTDGDGVADSGLGITTTERQQLATLYGAGTALWRVPVDHFTIWDSNQGVKPPGDAVAPTQKLKKKKPAVKDPCQQRNSVIDCEPQTLGETVPVTGTPFRLQYQSDRVPGRQDAYALEIPLSGASVPASLRRIDLEVLIAGKTTTQSFPAAPNQSTTFTWDGRDAYGRLLQGSQRINVRIGYVYGAVYGKVSRFGTQGNGIAITNNPARQELTLWQEWQSSLGPWSAREEGLGSWTLNIHHSYDPFGRILHRGDGRDLDAQTLSPIITTVAGGGNPPDGVGDGLPATQANISPQGVAVGSDGNLYIADYINSRVRRVGLDGVITTVAGNGTPGFSGDGGPATAAQLWYPFGVALGPDGSLYIADSYNHRIRRVTPDGLITTVAGSGPVGADFGSYSGDGGPATSAQIKVLRGLSVGPDGSIYFPDVTSYRVRRVSPDGLIDTMAGTGIGGYGGDGGPATAARLDPWGVKMGPDGSLYIADTFNFRVRRVAIDGTITTVAGNGGCCFSGDGGPATQANLNKLTDVVVKADGTIYTAGYADQRVRAVGPDGLITTLAGVGATGYGGDSGPAAAATLYYPTAVTVGPDGAVYIADASNGRVRRIAPSLPGMSVSNVVVPADDGTEVYVLDGTGRHLRTVDALTGATRYLFAYNAAGLLTTVTDANNNVTTIQRDGTGNPTAIVAPGGQQTTLTLEGNGYLAALTNPNMEKIELTYSADGLLATMKDPRGNLHKNTYDAQGRLIKDQDPAGGFKALARTEQSTGWTASVSTALNRTTTYQVENLTTGDLWRKVTDHSGLLTTMLIGQDGTTTVTVPDGAITTTVQSADPRFGMQAPITKSLTVRLPSALTSTLTSTRTATLSNPTDPLSLTSQTDTLVINGRTYTSVFTQSTKTLTTTTPVGRTSTVTLDAQGRVLTEQVTGLEPVGYTYDAQGRLATITQSTGATIRTSLLSYNSKNELTGVQDPLFRTVGFAYDLAGRITTQTLPDTRIIGYAYDGNGNVTSLTPPGKPAHAFAYTPVDLESNYNPPDAGFSPRNTQYTYNLDKQLTLVTRPDGQTLSLGYDPTKGRLNTLMLPGSQTLTYAYSATTGALSSITAPNSTLSYIYDGSLLKTTTWAGTVAGNVSRVYDTNFRISSQSVNGANTISFGYDNDSLLTTAGSLTITRSAQHGLITGSTLGVATDARTYSTFGELGTYTANVSGSLVFGVTYTRDKLGRITQKVETIGGNTNTFVYTYDLAGRLTDVSLNGGTVAHYVYDTNGNRASLTDSTGTTSGTYDAQDRLTQYGNLQFTYTTNGELLTKTNPTLGQTVSFVYDVLGNLKSATLPNGTVVAYVIDGQNRRIGKKVNGVLTQGFLYQNQLNPVAELDGAGAILSRFVYGTKASVPDYMIKAGVTYRILSDHLGSPRLIINTATGATVQRMDYDEFGNITADTNPGFQPFGFAGGIYDQHTGLVRFGARDYDAQVGRWTAKDPLGFASGSPNSYNYVLNDPLNFVDLWGLYTQQELAGIIYNESSSLSGPGIFEARQAIAFVAQNRETPGKADTGIASPQLSASAQAAIRNGVPSAQAAYDQALVAASLALNGCIPDPTQGAKEFNFRKNDSLSPRKGVPVLINIGPFDNSNPTIGNPRVPQAEQLPATGVYFNVYGLPKP